MLSIKKSVDVALQVNLRNHAGDQALKQGINPDFKAQGRRHQKSKTGASVVHKKDLCPPIFTDRKGR